MYNVECTMFNVEESTFTCMVIIHYTFYIIKLS